jgi:tetratricopeptide (TPR) repeat protein
MDNDTLDSPTLEQQALCRLVESLPCLEPVVAVVGRKAVPAARAVLPAVAEREGRLVGINLFPGDPTAGPLPRDEFEGFLRTEGFADYVVQVSGRGAGPAELVAPGSCDLVYLQEEAGYEGMRRTLLAWLPRLRSRGILCGALESLPAGPADYLSLLRGEPAEPGPGGGRGALRAILELLPRAGWEGTFWSQRRAEDPGLVTTVARELQRSVALQRRAERTFREEYARAFRFARDGEDPALRIAMLEQLVREYPGSLDPHLMLGREYLDLQRPDLAIRAYERPLRNGSGNATLYAHLGMAHAAAGDEGAAETYFKTALRLDPETMPAWLNLLILLLGRGDTEAARDCLDRALGVALPDQETAEILARVSLGLGDRTTLAKSLEQLLSIHPGHPLVLKLRAALEPAGAACREPGRRFVEVPLPVEAH